MEHSTCGVTALTEIKTRKLRPFECFECSVDLQMEFYFPGGNRVLEIGDRLEWIGNNGDFVDVLVSDRSGIYRWIHMSDDQVYVCQ